MNSTVFALWEWHWIKSKVLNPVLCICRPSETHDNKIFCLVICNKTCSSGQSAHHMSDIDDSVLFKVIVGYLAVPAFNAFLVTVWCNCENGVISGRRNIVWTGLKRRFRWRILFNWKSARGKSQDQNYWKEKNLMLHKCMNLY